jgi:hypothetical protein
MRTNSDRFAMFARCPLLPKSEESAEFTASITFQLRCATIAYYAAVTSPRRFSRQTL